MSNFVTDLAYANLEEHDILVPPFYDNPALTFSTVRGSSHFFYAGRSGKYAHGVNVMFRVTTAHVTPTWAEIGIFTGPVNFNGNTNLFKNGVMDASNFLYSGGTSLIHVRNMVIPLDSPIRPGQDVWFGIGCSASTQPILRGSLTDFLRTGISQVASNTRLSTAGTTGPISTTLEAEGSGAPYFRLGI